MSRHPASRRIFLPVRTSVFTRSSARNARRDAVHWPAFADLLWRASPPRCAASYYDVVTSLPSSAGSPLRRRGALMATLFAAQVCGSTGFSMSMAVGAIMAAAITGTNTWSGLPVGVGSLGTALASWPLAALAAMLVQALLRPDPLAIARRLEPPPATAGAARRGRPTGTILREPRVIVAYGTLMVSQLVMIGTTSTSPLYLHDHGHAVNTIGLAVSLHLGGMYVASPLSGWLCDRFGRLPVIGAGGVVLLLALALAGLAPGHAGGLVIAGLFLNGVGWNLAFVSASALLTDALSPEERAAIQGLADLVMGLMGAVGSALGGMVLGAWGFGILNILGAAMLVVPLAASWLQREALAARAAEPNPWAS